MLVTPIDRRKPMAAFRNAATREEKMKALGYSSVRSAIERGATDSEQSPVSRLRVTAVFDGILESSRT
jgi:hypothetical protein